MSNWRLLLGVLLLAVFLGLLWQAGGEKIDNAPQPGVVIRLPPIEWHVVSREELEKAYQAAGKEVPPASKLEGFAGKLPDGRAVIYTLPPRWVDDAATTTLGHEVLHVALGDYHQ